MKAFWLKRLWQHLMHKESSEGRLLSEQILTTWFGLLTPHLLWQQKNPKVSLTLWLNFSLFSFKCSWKHCAIFTQTVIYACWSRELSCACGNNSNKLSFLQCHHMRSLLVEKYHLPLENWSGLLQTVSAISGVIVTLITFFGVLVEQQTCLCSDSWRSGWLTVYLSRRGLGLSGATGYVLIGDDTDQRHKEMRWKQKRVELR